MKKMIYLYANLPSYRKDFFSKLHKELYSAGLEMCVYHGTLTDNKEVKQDTTPDYKVYSFTSTTLNLGLIKLVKMAGLFKAFRRENPDAVVISYMSTNLTMMRAALYCIRHNIPYASWRCGYSSGDYSKLSAKIRRRLISFVERHAQYVITYGSYYKNVLVSKGIRPDRIVIAQNTINVEAIVDKNIDLVRKYEGKDTKVLFVGALIKKKNLETSIAAVERLYNEGYDISFDIVGGGEMEQQLKEVVETKNLGNVVRLLGPKYGKDVQQCFRTHDVFLAAGLGGLAVNEAMAYGLPIISTNADWTVCDLIDGNGYFMDKYGDIEQQVTCLKEFISLTPEEKRIMSNRSLEIICSKASLANMVSKHKEVCLKMIGYKRAD